MLLIDYFGFNLASLPSTVTTIASATLVLEPGKVTDNVTYTLFGATQWVTQLETPGAQNAALYANMVNGAGANSYGTFQVAQNTTNTMLMFVLNGSAVADINAAIKSKAVFAVAGQGLGSLGAGALHLGHVARRLRRTWRGCASSRGQASGRSGLRVFSGASFRSGGPSGRVVMRRR
jgi:hypothetical protein